MTDWVDSLITATAVGASNVKPEPASIMYEIKVEASDIAPPWIVLKRFHDFKLLHSQLQKLDLKLFQYVSLPSITQRTSQINHSIDDKRRAVDLYLHKLISIKKCMRHEIMLDFLCVPEAIKQLINISSSSSLYTLNNDPTQATIETYLTHKKNILPSGYEYCETAPIFYHSEKENSEFLLFMLKNNNEQCIKYDMKLNKYIKSKLPKCIGNHLNPPIALMDRYTVSMCIENHNCAKDIELVIEKQHKILMIEDESDRIFMFDIKTNPFIWQETKIILPTKGNNGNRKFILINNKLLLFEDISIYSSYINQNNRLFETNDEQKQFDNTNNVWWTDITDIEHYCDKWYGCYMKTAHIARIVFDSIGMYYYGDYIHYIVFGDRSLPYCNQHYQVLLPQLMIEERYDKLVFGYVIKMEQELKLPTYNYFYIAKLIHAYALPLRDNA